LSDDLDLRVQSGSIIDFEVAGTVKNLRDYYGLRNWICELGMLRSNEFLMSCRTKEAPAKALRHSYFGHVWIAGRPPFEPQHVTFYAAEVNGSLVFKQELIDHLASIFEHASLPAAVKQFNDLHR
jgi:hypothetical protein